MPQAAVGTGACCSRRQCPTSLPSSPPTRGSSRLLLQPDTWSSPLSGTASRKPNLQGFASHPKLAGVKRKNNNRKIPSIMKRKSKHEATSRNNTDYVQLVDKNMACSLQPLRVTCLHAYMFKKLEGRLDMPGETWKVQEDPS